MVVKGYAILWVFCRGAISVTDFNELVVNVLVLRRSAWERPLQAIETAGNARHVKRFLHFFDSFRVAGGREVSPMGIDFFGFASDGVLEKGMVLNDFIDALLCRKPRRKLPIEIFLLLGIKVV